MRSLLSGVTRRLCEKETNRTLLKESVSSRNLYRYQGSRVRKNSGGLAQLGERLPCKQEVSGSNPLISIMGR